MDPSLCGGCGRAALGFGKRRRHFNRAGRQRKLCRYQRAKSGGAIKRGQDFSRLAYNDILACPGGIGGAVTAYFGINEVVANRINDTDGVAIDYWVDGGGLGLVEDNEFRNHGGGALAGGHPMRYSGPGDLDGGTLGSRGRNIFVGNGIPVIHGVTSAVGRDFTRKTRDAQCSVTPAPGLRRGEREDLRDGLVPDRRWIPGGESVRHGPALPSQERDSCLISANATRLTSHGRKPRAWMRR
ncbi:MAG: hypothetical protein HYV63_13610 [Candidatus Schekmanbacteria bacterium]|nr:hypothetical protein [Candidatus Schekmanbacteria bacterium]